MGWVLSWFLLLLAVPAVQMTTCTMGKDDTWLTSLLVFAPLCAMVLGAIALTPAHHSKFRWFSIPLLVIVPYCGLFAGKFLIGTSLQGHHLCSTLTGDLTGFDGYERSSWEPMWAPLQLALLAGYAWLAISSWLVRTPQRESWR